MGERFEGVLEQVARGGSAVEVPDEVVERLGPPARLRVRGTLNGVAFSSNLVPMGGRRLLGVHKATYEAAGIAFGERVSVDLERDDAPRVLEVPPEFERALARDEVARDAYERLSFTHRKEYATWIAEAKREETTSRRVERALELLRGGVKHP